MRPSSSDVANVELAIAGTRGRILLLGVTPELSVLGESLIAVDNSPQMIEAVWPGELRGDRLIYADMSHPEHRDYSCEGVVVLEI